MSVFIISSTEDPAGTNIKKQLLRLTSWEEQISFYDVPILSFPEVDDVYLITIPDRTIFHDNLDVEISKVLGKKPDMLLYLSRHSSKTGKPSLTAHPIGNYGPADFGGKPHTLVPAAPRFMTHLIRRIHEKHRMSRLGYQVCFEVTHHGPYLSTPTVFVEVGSTEVEWHLSEPAQVVATAVYDILKENRSAMDADAEIPVLLGIGGGHYAPRFTDIILERDAAFGHMIPAYHVDAGNITIDSVKTAISQTPDISGVYIHSKGLKKPQVRLFKEMLADLDIPVISSKDLPLLS